MVIHAVHTVYYGLWPLSHLLGGFVLPSGAKCSQR